MRILFVFTSKYVEDPTKLQLWQEDKTEHFCRRQEKELFFLDNKLGTTAPLKSNMKKIYLKIDCTLKNTECFILICDFVSL